MTPSDLVQLLSDRFSQLTQGGAETAVSTILEAMNSAMVRGHRIEIRGYGSFSVIHHASRMGHNPRSCVFQRSWTLVSGVLAKIKVAGKWKYVYRPVDRASDTVDFLLTAKRGEAAARRFLENTINLHGVPEKITRDNSGANTTAIESVKTDACVDILMRQNKY